jgi:hypothetical protein
MAIFCSPQYLLIGLVSVILLLGGISIVWQVRVKDHHYDTGKWMLISFSIIAVVSLGTFLAFTFIHIGGPGGLGC